MATLTFVPDDPLPLASEPDDDDDDVSGFAPTVAIKYQKIIINFKMFFKFKFKL